MEAGGEWVRCQTQYAQTTCLAGDNPPFALFLAIAHACIDDHSMGNSENILDPAHRRLEPENHQNSW